MVGSLHWLPTGVLPASKSLGEWRTWHNVRAATTLGRRAKTRAEPVFGISPWYCAAELIEYGTKVAFIDANPVGGARSKLDDERVGRLPRSYEDPQYNAWLDDTH